MFPAGKLGWSFAKLLRTFSHEILEDSLGRGDFSQSTERILVTYVRLNLILFICSEHTIVFRRGLQGGMMVFYIDSAFSNVVVNASPVFLTGA